MPKVSIANVKTCIAEIDEELDNLEQIREALMAVEYLPYSDDYLIDVDALLGDQCRELLVSHTMKYRE